MPGIAAFATAHMLSSLNRRNVPFDGASADAMRCSRRGS
jgi:hypothetical protein